MSNLDQVIDDVRHYFDVIRDSAKEQGMAGYLLIGMVMESSGNAGIQMSYPKNWSYDTKMSVLKQMVGRIENEMELEKKLASMSPKK